VKVTWAFGATADHPLLLHKIICTGTVAEISVSALVSAG
jgi:hypothetical protein